MEGFHSRILLRIGTKDVNGGTRWRGKIRRGDVRFNTSQGGKVEAARKLSEGGGNSSRNEEPCPRKGGMAASEMRDQKGMRQVTLYLGQKEHFTPQPVA